MGINPNALVLWALSAGIGWLVSGGRGAVVGLVVGLAMSLLAAILPRRGR